MIAARTGYTGEDGFELFCAMADARALWHALLAAGEPLGIEPIGLGARDTLRLEARLLALRQRHRRDHEPDRGRPRLDREARQGRLHRPRRARARQAEGLPRKLVGFEMTGRGIARHGYPIVDRAGKTVGQVTSGAPSLSLGKNVGLGYVPIALSETGTPLGIEIRGKVVDAVVVRTPFYKRS